MAKTTPMYCKECDGTVYVPNTKEQSDDIKNWTMLRGKCPECGKLLSIRVK